MNNGFALKLNKNTRMCLSLSARPGNFGTRFQNYLYDKLNIDYLYKSFTTTNLEDAIKGIRALGIRGFALSMPFKEEVLPLLDEVSPAASELGAVNTVVNNNNTLVGYNTDAIAVKRLFQANGVESSYNVALFGSGGMAKAIAYTLAELSFSSVTIIARNEKNGPALARRYGFDWKAKNDEQHYDVLINASPVGMHPYESDPPAFNDTQIEKASFVMDSVAIPVETNLVKKAREMKCLVIDGFQITTLQSVEQFILYTGVTPDRAAFQEAAEFARQ